jgi:hypothetical protein
MDPAAFVMCPLGHMTPVPDSLWWCQLIIYAMAFQQAQAVVRPSLPERDLLAVWN